jgi:hypothetical protein
VCRPWRWARATAPCPGRIVGESACGGRGRGPASQGAEGSACIRRAAAPPDSEHMPAGAGDSSKLTAKHDEELQLVAFTLIAVSNSEPAVPFCSASRAQPGNKRSP